MKALGRWISFEGIDGSGKSTLVAAIAGALRGLALDPVITREPGGTPLGEALRQVLLRPDRDAIDPWAELLLYTASRIQQQRRVIEPALSGGRWVLSDRWLDATLAYQGWGRGLPCERIRAVHRWAVGDTRPDLTVLLDCAPAIALGRCRGRRACPGLDRVEAESLAFFNRVRRGYRALAADEPARFLVLNGERDAAEVARDGWSRIAERLNLERR